MGIRRNRSARSRLWGLVPLVAAVALLAAACGGGDSNETAPTEDTTEAATVAESAAVETGAVAATDGEEVASGWEACDAEGLEVAIIPHFKSPFTEEFVDGARAAAEECNAELTATGPQAIDTEAQVRQFQDLVAKGIEVIVTVAYPADVWVRPIDEAVAEGVTVSSVDVGSPESQQFVHSASNQLDFGRAMGEAIIARLGPDASGTFVTGICFPGLDVLEQRIAGFKEIMNEQLPNVEVIGPFDVTFDPGKNYIAWQRLVQQNPDALGFAGPCDGDPANLLKLKRQEGADWLIGGPNLEPDTLAGIKEGLVDVLVSADPFMQGYVAMRATLQKVVLGEDLPSGWINPGIEVVTSENVDAVTERFNSLEEGYQGSREYYAERIDEIFSDLPGHIQPWSAYTAPE